jgi:uncharacterized protein (TIGR00725 family)
LTYIIDNWKIYYKLEERRASEMSPFLQQDNGIIRNERGQAFDPAAHIWRSSNTSGQEVLGAAVSGAEAVRMLVKHQGARRLPVGIIGPNEASDADMLLAEQAGAAVAGLGLPMICGGRGGAMEAASRGAAQAGGLVIGILPSHDWMSANSHVSVPIASGIGEARNAIIASACFALIAVGGGHGTLSEMALALKMGRLVIAMGAASRIAEAMACDSIDAAIAAVARRYLGLDQ